MTTPVSSKMSRWQMVALPFKTYVVAVPALLLLYSLIRPSEAWLFHSNRSALDHVQATILTPMIYGYWISIPALVLCGVLADDKRVLRSTLIFTALALISLILLHPAVVLPATK